MIDPQRLDEILEVLRDRGASSFSCPEFSVSLVPEAPAEMKDDTSTAIKEGNAAAAGKTLGPRGMFAHPSLHLSAGFPGVEK